MLLTSCAKSQDRWYIAFHVQPELPNAPSLTLGITRNSSDAYICTEHASFFTFTAFVVYSGNRIDEIVSLMMSEIKIKYYFMRYKD